MMTSEQLDKLEFIVDGEFYDYYGVYDPLRDLFKALMFTPEEKLEFADLIHNRGSDYIRGIAAQLYKECGRTDKYISYTEEHLRDKVAPYLEVVAFYQDSDPAKAVAIAELGLKKCKNDQTDLFIFLIRKARESGDSEREAKLIKSAKMRRAVDYRRVQEALGL